MRVVVQRVLRAKVVVNQATVSEIQAGIVVFVGVAEGDGSEQIKWMAEKLAHLRVFEDDAGKLNLSVLECDHEILLVSNFTVCGDAQKGRRPSFDKAAKFETGKQIFLDLVTEIQSFGAKVETGMFGADMKIELVNDGPVTLIIDK